MPGDPAGRPDQVPQDRLALDDPRVLGDVDGGRRLVREAGQVGAATDRLELVAPLERLGDGDDVDRLAPLEQVEHRRVDAAVGLPVEVLGAQELGDLDDRVAVDEDGAEHGLLGFETLRRQTIDHRQDSDGWLGASLSVGGCARPVNEPPRCAGLVPASRPMWASCGRLLWISPEDTRRCR